MFFITEPPKNPLIEIIKAPIVIEQQIEIPEPVQVRDPNNCEPAMYWALEAPYYCVPKPSSVVTARTTKNPSQPIKNASDGTNSYAPGYCTWYVADTLSWVPNGWGNANRWASNARSQGYTVSTTPVIGSVAQTSSGSLGHVAVVTSITDDTVTISEMNYKGRYIISSRTVPVNEFIYIY